MTGRLRSPAKSLGVRLLALFCLTVGVGLTVQAIISYRATERALQTVVHDPLERSPPEGPQAASPNDAAIAAAMQTTRTRLLWTTLALVLVIGVVAWALIRRLVARPVSLLRKGTRRIAAGDLETRIDVRGEHDLAQLGSSLNHMAAELGAARHEVTEWSRKLEEKVVAKTQELQNAQRQVLHMEKMASLGKLAATVAHELNNPMSGILTYSRLIDRQLSEPPLDEATREELREHLSLVQQESARCGAIVKNLLLFARRRGVEIAPTDVNEIVQRSLMLVGHHFEMHGLELRCETLAENSEILADAGQLQQALIALFVNAVDAMTGPGGDEGGVLTVHLEEDAEEVRIGVSDTGTGIPPDVLPQIFEPFFSTKGEQSGVGLGLAVVYGIVQRHKGHIDIVSNVGEGTTFTLRLPRHPGPVAGDPMAVGATRGPPPGERTESRL